MSISPRAVSLAALALAVFIIVGAHVSQAVAERGDATNPNEDALSAKDHAAYRAGDFAERFGLTFRSHAAVCPEAGAGAARCAARVITDAKGSPAVTRTAVTGLTPAQLLKAYGLASTTAGNPIVGIVDAYDDPTIVADVATYSTNFGIPQLPACAGAVSDSAVPCLSVVNQSGATSPLPAANSGWALEIALDVEAAHALCENCRVLLVEASSNSFADLFAAEDYATGHAAVVSNSWGGGEFPSETTSTYDDHFNHPGIAITVASGDNGYGTGYPAASRYVTAVGGTTLILNGDGSYSSEKAWSGSGSGCSKYEAKPSWQHDAKCAKRTIADVSAVADPNTGMAVYDSTPYAGSTGWFQVGGTSLSSPLIAAVYVLSTYIPSATQEASLPYSRGSYATNLHDVTTGSNGRCGASTYLCTAVAGYDGPTGLGTPKGASAF